jgi:hypothetical protein
VQVDSLIQQDVQVSQAISLLNTNGSEVLLGNVLTIPIDQSLLYIRPLYVSSKTQGSSIPELKKVIVVYGQQVAYQNTLEEALQQLFPGLPSNLTQEQGVGAGGGAPTPGGTTTPVAPSGSQTVSALLAQAQQLFTAGDAALAQTPPDFATFEKDQNAARALITQAAQQSGAAPATSPSTTAAPSPSTTAAPAPTTTAQAA